MHSGGIFLLKVASLAAAYYLSAKLGEQLNWPPDARFLVSGVVTGAILLLLVTLSERRRAHRLWQQSEREWRALLAPLQDVIAVFDAAGTCLQVAPTKAVNVYPLLSEVTGSDWRERYLPEQAEQYLDYIRQAVATGEVVEIEYPMNIGDEERWMAATITPTSVHTVTFVAHDFTARKRALEQAHFQARLLDVVEQAVIATNRQREVIYWNGFAQKLYGWAAAEVLGQKITDFIPRHKIGRQDREMAVCCDAGGTWTGESVWTARDGKAVPVLVSAAPFYDEQGKLAGMVTVSTDLTARKQLEEELRQAHKLEAVGKLAGGIAHDFNNLLTAINGYSHLLLHQLDENDTRRARVREIHHAGERAAELTQQLLAFSRKQILQPKIIDLNAAIVGMEQLLRSSVGENIHLQMHLATQECKVKTDPGQITQVVLNLVVNARDAMPRGGILNIETVQVYLNYKRAHQHGLSGAGNFVKLLVSDTGQGMDEETRARIFEPFFTTKEQGQGTGLGLATVYGIIRQSGGSIQVESKIGAGTRFSIYLPLAEEHEEELLPLTETTLSLTPVAETILLVEDEEQVRELLTNLLREQGYQVLPACDGAEACRLCQQQPVDLLLTDIVLPNESGYELAAQVSALCPEVKVLYMSGYVEQTGRQPEAAMFLQKPFPLDELLSKIRTALKAEAAEAQVLQVAAS